MDTTPVKLGGGEFGLQTRVRYPDVWSLEETAGPPRLRVGPSSRHVEVLLSLARVWQADYYLLYVLLISRQGKRAPGRYQSSWPLAFDEVAAFCRTFAPFLEGDGRHHLWIGSTVEAGLLIYDHHDWIYAYGDLPAYIRVLQSQGFREGELVLPAPHHHNFNPVFDAAEDEVAAYCHWQHSPLQPDDEY